MNSFFWLDREKHIECQQDPGVEALLQRESLSDNEKYEISHTEVSASALLGWQIRSKSLSLIIKIELDFFEIRSSKFDPKLGSSVDKIELGFSGFGSPSPNFDCRDMFTWDLVSDLKCRAHSIHLIKVMKRYFGETAA